MDSNTIGQTLLGKELAQLFSKHITTYLTEHPEANSRGSYLCGR